VISAFSSDGRIAADDLVLLSDPKGALPPYDAVILVSPKRAGDPRLLDALKPLAAASTSRRCRPPTTPSIATVGKKSPAEASQLLSSRP
jgi:osmoprotectant transport system permease protein